MSLASAHDEPSPVQRFIAVQMTGLLFPLAAGVIAFGWRAIVCMGLVSIGAAAGWWAWKQVGRRGRHLHLLHCLWLGLLLCAMLPAHLAAGQVATSGGPTAGMLWPALPAAGLLLIALNWLLGGTAGGRINPALVCYLGLVVLLGTAALTPHLMLRRGTVVTGDVLDYRREPLAELSLAWEHVRKGLLPGAARPIVAWEDPWRRVVEALAEGPYLGTGTDAITWVRSVDEAVREIRRRLG